MLASRWSDERFGQGHPAPWTGPLAPDGGHNVGAPSLAQHGCRGGRRAPWLRGVRDAASFQCMKSESAGAPAGAATTDRHEIVAEVTSAIHCANFIQAGQVFVFDMKGVIKAEKSTANLCLGILARIQPGLLMAMDRAAEGLHPVSPRWRNFDCYDLGIDHGGMGKVTVKLHLRDAATHEILRELPPPA